MTIRPKDRKLAELILFISERSEGDPRFGAEKLNKLLFYSDFAAYLLLGKSITSQAYQKLPVGPAPRRLIPVREALVARADLAIRTTESSNRKQERTFALRGPNLTGFTAEEIALVTKIIQQNWDRDASQRGYFSNDSAHWEDAPEFETIPYEFALLSKRSPTQRERELCEADSARAAAVLSGQQKVVLFDEKALFRRGVRQPARRSRTTHPSNQGESSGAAPEASQKSGIRKRNRRKSSALVRRDA
jgi:hypothetical protein